MKNSNFAIEVVADLIRVRAAGTEMTKKQFAAKHNISPSSVSRYEAKFYDEAAKLVKKQDQKSKKPKNDHKASKKEVALKIFKEMEGADRKEVIERFMKEANLTKAGASTYHYNIKKQLDA